MSRDKLWKIFIKCSGFILLLIILWRVDTRSILQALSNVNIVAISPVFFLFLAVIYLKAKRWGILLVNSNVNTAGEHLFSIYIGSFLPGAVTPGKLGEIIKYKMLKNKKFDNNLGLTLSIQDRMWDFSFLFFIGSLSLFYINEGFSYLLFLIPCFLFSIVASTRPEVFIQFFEQRLSRISPKSRYAQTLFTLSKHIIRLSLKDIILCGVLTVCSWSLYFSQVYLLFRATGNGYSFMFVSCVVAASSVIGMLPISVAGIGTRDVALVGLFSLSGKSPEAAIILSTCILGAFLAGCMISFPFWIYISRSLELSCYNS